jgi:hypothetical protein
MTLRPTSLTMPHHHPLSRIFIPVHPTIGPQDSILSLSEYLQHQEASGSKGVKEVRGVKMRRA